MSKFRAHAEDARVVRFNVCNFLELVVELVDVALEVVGGGDDAGGAVERGNGEEEEVAGAEGVELGWG